MQHASVNNSHYKVVLSKVIFLGRHFHTIPESNVLSHSWEGAFFAEERKQAVKRQNSSRGEFASHDPSAHSSVLLMIQFFPVQSEYLLILPRKHSIFPQIQWLCENWPAQKNIEGYWLRNSSSKKKSRTGDDRWSESWESNGKFPERQIQWAEMPRNTSGKFWHDLEIHDWGHRC